MLLAIDTATSHISLALHDGHAVIGEITWLSANNHTLELAPAVQGLLARARLDIAQLTALAVARGPGSYSALRIGVAFAKGIAALHALPLVGVTTLDIAALAHPYYSGDLIPVVQAGRTRITAARYTWDETAVCWQIASEMQNYAWGDLIAEVRERGTPAWITGEVDPSGTHLIAAAQAQGDKVTLVSAAMRLRRAGYLAQEAWARLKSSENDSSESKELFDAAALVPVYVKTNL